VSHAATTTYTASATTAITTTQESSIIERVQLTSTYKHLAFHTACFFGVSMVCVCLSLCLGYCVSFPYPVTHACMFAYLHLSACINDSYWPLQLVLVRVTVSLLLERAMACILKRQALQNTSSIVRFAPNWNILTIRHTSLCVLCSLCCSYGLDYVASVLLYGCFYGLVYVVILCYCYCY
jgi:hypothetical protein